MRSSRLTSFAAHLRDVRWAVRAMGGGGVRRVDALRQLMDRAGVRVEKRTVYAGSVKTSYLSAGSGSPIILLHGSGTGGIIWYPVIGRLSEHFRLIIPDVVGYGESDKPAADYDRQYFCNWLGDLLDCLGMPTTNLVGSSHGGVAPFPLIPGN